MKEIWKDIPNYENSYQVSSFGRVRSKSRYVNDGAIKHKPLKSKIIKEHKYNGKYRVLLHIKGKQKQISVDYLVGNVFLQNPYHLPSIVHLDGDLYNNNIHNLKWENLAKYDNQTNTANNEIWKDIKGYKGYYQVSNLGHVRSVSRYVRRPETHKLLFLHSHLIKPESVNGYLRVLLYKNNKSKTYLVHRLVAEAFLSNPHQYPQINHRNEDTTDNRVSNLEYCSSKYNCNYGHHRLHVINKMGHSVQLSKNGKTYKFISMASTARWLKHYQKPKSTVKGIKNCLRRCCKPKYNDKTIYGYKAKFL